MLNKTILEFITLDSAKQVQNLSINKFKQNSMATPSSNQYISNNTAMLFNEINYK